MYTAVPASAMIVPITHMKRERPTLPDSARMVLGVAKIPVPMTLLKIKKEALTMPIWRRSSGEASKTFPSSGWSDEIQNHRFPNIHNPEIPSARRSASLSVGLVSSAGDLSNVSP